MLLMLWLSMLPAGARYMPICNLRMGRVWLHQCRLRITPEIKTCDPRVTDHCSVPLPYTGGGK